MARIALRPDFIEAWFNLGNTCKDSYQFEAGPAAYDRALEVQPDFFEAQSNRGFVSSRCIARWKRCKPMTAPWRWTTARPTCGSTAARPGATASLRRGQRVLSPRPRTQARRQLGRLERRPHAIAGRFPQGWPAYEARWETEQMRSQRRQFLQPLWLGESSLQGKTILLHAEQGFGDTLQFVRYCRWWRPWARA
jgi:tetratricopeptide (TPR) repeat protein